MEPTTSLEPAAVFVYGTLMPGLSRWHSLAPFAAGQSVETTVAGRLYDTGRGYPAAIFVRPSTADPSMPADGAGDGTGGIIPGRRVPLRPESLGRCLQFLDEIEGVAGGLYRRVRVRTDAGEPAWSYAWGGDLDGLTRIARWDSAPEGGA